MKQTVLSVILMLMAAFSVNAQNVNIPDPNFKNFLVNHTYHNNPGGSGINIPLDINHDGEIQYSEAVNYPASGSMHGFFLSGLNISDLTGIEAFDSVEQLYISDNPITTLDISGCLSLKKINAIYNNAFTALNLVSATLEELDITCPTMTSLNLSGCPALKVIRANNNPIMASLNINGCGAVKEFQAYQNPLLTTLTMGSHYYMTLFQVQSDNLSSIDVSGCHSLQYLFIGGNPLTSLNMANGNPQSFISIAAQGFPDLTCIKVNNVVVSEYLWTQNGGNYVFDEWVHFSTDCSPPGPCIVSIPDANLKTWLTANTTINTNGNTEIECAEALAYTGAINVDNTDISDMTGIAEFKNITSLSCNNISMWNFTTLDVSGLTALTTVSCTGNNQLNSLNVSGCTALTTFSTDTGSNGGMPFSVNASNCTSLTGFTVTQWANLSLNLSGCTALTGLDLDDKNLSSLNINNCSALTSLICSNNDLTALSFTGCSALTTINCSNNNITALAVNNVATLANLNCSGNELASLMVFDNPNLTVLNCSDNHLPYLLVSNNAALAKLNCSKNNITYLDVNNNVALTDLDCSYNNLTSQNVSSNVALVNYNCGHNNLNAVNVGMNTALKSLHCYNNNLSTINVSSNILLGTLYCDHNNLATINTSNNVNLKTLSCSFNQLTNLNVSSASLIQLNCSNNQLTVLDISSQETLYILDCSHNQLSALDVSNTHCFSVLCNNNQLTSLNLANSYNVNAFAMVANSNAGLECVQVDNVVYSSANWTGLDYVFDAGVTFSENCALGTGSFTGSQAFSIYPNPTKSVVNFSKRMNVQLYTVTGQLIAAQQDAESFNLSRLPTGVYLIVFTDHNGQMVQRSKVVKE